MKSELWLIVFLCAPFYVGGLWCVIDFLPDDSKIWRRLPRLLRRLQASWLLRRLWAPRLPRAVARVRN